MGSGEASSPAAYLTESADSRRQLVAEEEVRADSLVDGEECWLSNGVRGFFCGRVAKTQSLVPY